MVDNGSRYTEVLLVWTQRTVLVKGVSVQIVVVGFFLGLHDDCNAGGMCRPVIGLTLYSSDRGLSSGYNDFRVGTGHGGFSVLNLLGLEWNILR